MSKLSEFNKEMLNCLDDFLEYPKSSTEIGNQYLWNNDNIKTPNRKTIEYILLKKIGINYVKDLIFENKIMTLGQSHPKCKTSLEKFNLKSVIKLIPSSWKQNNFSDLSENVNCLEEITSKKIYIKQK